MCWIKHIKTLNFFLCFYIRSTIILPFVKRDIILCLLTHEMLSFFFSSPHVADAHNYHNEHTHYNKRCKYRKRTWVLSSPAATLMHCPTCLILGNSQCNMTGYTKVKNEGPWKWRKLLKVKPRKMAEPGNWSSWGLIYAMSLKTAQQTLTDSLFYWS